MVQYVALVPFQVEPFPHLHDQSVTHPPYQCIQSIRQAWHGIEIRLFQIPTAGSGFSQHLPDPVTLFLFALPGFGHLLPEVLRIEDQTFEQEL
jgi:hypothetical protein